LVKRDEFEKRRVWIGKTGGGSILGANIDCRVDFSVSRAKLIKYLGDETINRITFQVRISNLIHNRYSQEKNAESTKEVTPNPNITGKPKALTGIEHKTDPAATVTNQNPANLPMNFSVYDITVGSGSGSL
jgi:hypothetical protein